MAGDQITPDELARKIESHDNSFQDQLNALKPEERASIARQAESINHEHCRENPKLQLPELHVDVEKDDNGKEYLANMKVSEERSDWNPLKYVMGEKSETQVYNEPWNDKFMRWDEANVQKPMQKAIHDYTFVGRLEDALAQNPDQKKE